MDDLFRPPLGDWTDISPRLATARRLIGSIVIVSTTAALVAVVAIGVATDSIPAWPMAIPAGLGLFALAWLWRWAGVNRRAWGYLETADDLIVTRGVVFRRLVAVPYGRMQYVDVQAGPLAQRLGFASVTLHTASTATVATIPGVPAAEAHALRDRLTALGDSRGAGL